MEGKKACSSDYFNVYSGGFPGYFCLSEDERNAIWKKDENNNNVVAETNITKKDENNETVAETSSITIDYPLRAPICCMLGPVDSGKTSLLDCMRGPTYHLKPTHPPPEFTRTNSATYLKFKPDYPNLKLPGLLYIDTPGLADFTRSRSQAVALCDIAILVLDITLDLHPITIESLDLLQMWNKKFIVALNHIDKISGWKSSNKAPSFRQAYDHQSFHTQQNFSSRFKEIVTQFKQHGIQAQMYYDNKKRGETVSIVPTSAISGEGLVDIKSELIKWTQKTMIHNLTYTQEELQCTVLDVNIVEGHGTTINVVLVNGTLHVGDQIVVCATQGQIVTSIQALWTAPPNKELDAKAHYICHKEIKGVKVVKIIAQGLEHAIAGTDLRVVKPGDDSKDDIGHEHD